VVCPDAKFKLYITASLEVRTNRRYKELQERGEEAIRSAVLDDIKTRDERDSARALSPLKPAGDAKIIDSSGFNASEVFSLAQEFIRSQMK
jgi:cytidylate kinase